MAFDKTGRLAPTSDHVDAVWYTAIAPGETDRRKLLDAMHSVFLKGGRTRDDGQTAAQTECRRRN
eukprot:7286905-Heterocapsa_arctica.AAC.1